MIRNLLLLVVLLSGFSFTGCRKGPEDPLISFATRKARLSKEWKAYSYKINGEEKLRSTITTKQFQGECDTQTVVRFDSLEIIMDFRKSGEFFSNRYHYFTEKSATAANPSPFCALLNYYKTDEETERQSGYWNFTGGVGDISNREQVFIYQEESAVGILWDIVRLAGSELKIKRRYIPEGQSEFSTEEIYFYPN
jgi:hypothetical protein